jgi:hypothetical protein
MKFFAKAIGAVLAAMAVCGFFFWLGYVSHPATTAPVAVMEPIPELHGPVTRANFDRFEAFVSSHLDRVIGLKVSFDTDEKAKGLNASADGGQFVTYVTPNTQTEIVANSGYSFQHGSYVFDGFFIVKNGGMHQGVVSYGLVQAKEEAIRLSGSPIQKQELR